MMGAREETQPRFPTSRPADTSEPIHPLLRYRYSPRVFGERELGDHELRSLLEAARWAASSFNEQPWRFLIARRRDEEEFAKMLTTLAPANQEWAQHADVLMVAVAREEFSRNDRPNRHHRHDVGAAIAQLTAQATSLGIAVHPMAGFSADAVRDRYDVPEGFAPTTAIALGQAVDPEDLELDARDREMEPRRRKPLEELVFEGEWGRPSGLATS